MRFEMVAHTIQYRQEQGQTIVFTWLRDDELERLTQAGVRLGILHHSPRTKARLRAIELQDFAFLDVFALDGRFQSLQVDME